MRLRQQRRQSYCWGFRCFSPVGRAGRGKLPEVAAEVRPPVSVIAGLQAHRLQPFLPGQNVDALDAAALVAEIEQQGSMLLIEEIRKRV